MWIFSAPRWTTVRGYLINLCVGLAIGLLLFLGGHRVLGEVVLVISSLIFLLSTTSKMIGDAISRWLNRLAEFAAKVVTYILLVPIYYCFFTMANLFLRVSGRDSLSLRRKGSPTFWLPCDPSSTKIRHIRRMFATETPTSGSRPVRTALFAFLVLFFIGEIVLRIFGFGNPPLYVADPTVGYYPAPHQRINRYGGLIMTNQYGMRAPDISPKKTRGNFRILMIGDSTLWGGSYIDQERLYARLLEKKLNAGDGLPGSVEVLNIGSNGWGPYHKLGYVQRFGIFEADVAVICLPIGDIYRPLSGLEGGPFWTAGRPPILAWDELIFHLLWRYSESRRGGWTEKSRWVQGRRGIVAYLELSRWLRKAGCEVFIEVLPSREEGLIGGEPTELPEFKQMMLSENFQVAFPQGFFNGKGKRVDLYHDKAHLHWKGHIEYANYLASRLPGISERFRKWKSLLQNAPHYGDNP